MGSKITVDLPTRKPSRPTEKKSRKLRVCQDARARGVNPGAASFCYLCKVRKPVQCSRLRKILRCCTCIAALIMQIFHFNFLSVERIELVYRVQQRSFAYY